MESEALCARSGAVESQQASKQKQRRLAAVGASVALLAAGAICGYAAVGTGAERDVVQTETLAANTAAFVIPDENNNGDDVTPVYIPPFFTVDTDSNGEISNKEYLAFLASLRDDALNRLAASTLSTEDKHTISEHLANNYVKESGCVTRLANRDRKKAGAISDDRFDLFYSMIKEFCTVDDPLIPEEFLPRATPPPITSTEPSQAIITPTSVPPTDNLLIDLMPGPPSVAPANLNLQDGQAVKCDSDSPAIYRYSAGEIQLYPNPTIAASWDPQWEEFVVIDCSSLPHGVDMVFKPAPTSNLEEGQAIKCDIDQPAVYRYASGEYRLYPTPDIASSWDPDWDRFVVVDCSGLEHGADMTYKLPSVPEGQAVACNPWRQEIFRFTGEQIRLYPNAAIAESWDPAWKNSTQIDCSHIERGPDMEMRLPSPVSLIEGQAVKCDANSPEVFRFTGGELRLYPNPAIAESWDLNWTNFSLVNCSSLQHVEDMTFNAVLPSNVDEGQAIKCDADQPAIYRYAAGTYRLYPNPDVAESWDPNWKRFVVVDCSTLSRGDDMEYKLPSISEGQAVACNSWRQEIFRFTGGQIRLYPNHVIAESWDPAWTDSVVQIDCSHIPRGPDMLMKPAPPSSLVDGQSIKCDWYDPAVYRFTAGERRYYPTPEIATSWNPDWDGYVVVDCSQIPRGDDMTFKKAPPANVVEGQAIKCDADSPAIYRFTGGEYRLYPNPDIASSWDSNWGNFVIVDCSSLNRGDDMALKLPAVQEGEAVTCNSWRQEIFRFTGGQIRLYPNPAIAASWDPAWLAPTQIDCSHIPRGLDMPMKPTEPALLAEGQAIKCDLSSPAVFRFTGGQMRLYPNPTIASSWDPDWGHFVLANCSSLERVEDMAFKTVLPSNVADGQAIKCDVDQPSIYRYAAGEYRLYPTPDIAQSWDLHWADFVVVDCSTLHRGDDMAYFVPLLEEGQSVLCDGTEDLPSRFSNGRIWRYPSAEIAESWDPNWALAPIVDCSHISRGPDMQLKLPPVAVVAHEGDTVKCDPNSSELFRYTGETIRLYPTPDIAASWNPDWSSFQVVDCSSVRRGDDMGYMKIPFWNLEDGKAVRCDGNSPAVFRYSGTEYRLYPTPEIAASWDPNWSNTVVVDCDSLHRGADMEYKLPALREGMAVKCSTSSPAIFRYSSGQLRLYPTPTVAASWDPDWAYPMIVDCSHIQRGPDMEVKLPSPDSLMEGQSVKCNTTSPEVLRFTGGELRLYPNPAIAESWDANWGNFTLVDCSSLQRVEDMEFMRVPPSNVDEGQAIKCDADQPAIYRYAAGTYRLYPNPDVAESWDPNWKRFVVVDCSTLSRGDDMEYKLPSISEGQAVACNSWRQEIFRFTGGQIRLYPNHVIAESWDPAWTDSVVQIDCSHIPRGPDMLMKPAPPSSLVDGQSIKCDWYDPAVYRFTAGERRYYPTPEIATSWNPDWDGYVVVDCSQIPRGDDMTFKKAPPANVVEGQAIKCDADSPAIYRFTGGEYRLYPNPDIASSWDSNWGNFVIVDCSSLNRGDDMALKLPAVQEGEAVTCNSWRQEIFRFTGGQIRLYPNPAIAASWDPAWLAPTQIDCSHIPRGPDMSMKLPSPDVLPDGQAIKCDPAEPEIYRLTSGQRRWYPNPAIAASWDSSWSSPIVVNCTLVSRGDDMPFRSILPSELVEGQAIKCDDNRPEVYRFTGMMYRWYPNPDIASSWDPNWGAFVVANCTALNRGPDMPYFVPSIPEGQAVRCNPLDTAIYRFSNGVLRLYPTLEVAISWDPLSMSPMLIDCSHIPRGPNLSMKLRSPFGLPEGQSIKCDPDRPEVYRYAGGEYRWYPNPDIALSWDTNWGNPMFVNCTILARGPDLAYKAPAVMDGEAIRCNDPLNTGIYRLTDGVLRQYPDPMTAASWGDPGAWATQTIVDCTRFPRGPPIDLKLRSPYGLPEGVSIKCDPNRVEVYRFTGGQYRWYPSRAIAVSWDRNWANVTVVNCTGVTQGPDMAYKIPTIEEGQAIRCSPVDPAISRFTNGQLRWYPSPAIAASWDPAWANPIVVDCSQIPRGPPMMMKLISPIGLEEGQAIKCDPDRPEVYRFTAGQYRWYPDPPTASSWDTNWSNFSFVDCSSITRGPDMPYKLPAVTEGQAVRCSPSDPAIFRFTDGQLRLYPSRAIAVSWDPEWASPVILDCSHISIGPLMPMKLRSPEGLPEGQAIKCDPDSPEIYRYTGGLYRLYPDSLIATSWDTNSSNFLLVNCSTLARGVDMSYKIPVIAEGQLVKCSSSVVNPSTLKIQALAGIVKKMAPIIYETPNVYRFENGQLRLYPDWGVLNSWEKSPGSAITIDCSHIPIGPMMQMNLPSPIGLQEGQVIKCGYDQPEVYRYTAGQYRLYPDSHIAWSWDENFANLMFVNCSTLTRGIDMPYKLPDIAEGQAVRCSQSDPAIFRFENGQLRLYPSPDIAASWDPSWQNAIVVDCYKIQNGLPMQMKLLPPDGLQEGQAIKCDPDRPEVYRYTAGEYRWYPSPPIASSWDPNWGNLVLVNCTTLRRGKDMAYKTVDLANIVEGQAIKCDVDRPEVYRYAAGEYRWYPNPDIASSWDANWGNFAIVDCSVLRRGADMQYKLPSIPEGQAVRCSPVDPAIHRFTDGQLRWYPSPAIAASWDPTWGSPVIVDCSRIPKGAMMPMKLLSPDGLPEGLSIKCDPDRAEVYRLTGGQYRWYPDPPIASSWDPNWSNITFVNCSTLVRGADMPYKLPELNEGQAVRCSPADPAIHRFTDGQLRWYPSPAIAASWDPEWANPLVVDCARIPKGPMMQLKLRFPEGLAEGQAIKCNPDRPEVFRYTGGQIRWYPDPPIASSWDPNYANFLLVNCSTLIRGPDMPYRIPTIAEGQAIKCNSEEPAIYRFVDGQMRWYPSPTIAASWDPAWASPIVVDCSHIPRGQQMQMKLRSPDGLEEGQPIKCDPDRPEIYRYTGGQYRWYPDPPIAASWDPNYGNVLFVNCSTLARGPDMPYKIPAIAEGQAVRCSVLDPAIHRFTQGQLRWYPNPTIAASWDPAWASPIVLDCSHIPMGKQMSMKLRSPDGLAEGQAIKCDPDRPEVFRYTGSQIRWYPDPPIAASWDPDYANFLYVNCSSLFRGNDMAYKIPAIEEAQAIKCNAADPAIYRFTDGQMRWYPSPAIAGSWDPSWASPIVVDCSHIPRGQQMPMKLRSPDGLPEGQAIKCDADRPEVYRLTGGQYRWYPDGQIAASWDSNVANFMYVNCTTLTQGADMPYKLPAIPEGQAVRCSLLDPAIHRFTGGQLRWYPNPTIAASWDPAWANATVVDCSRIPRGPDMTIKLRSPDGLPEGQAIKCDPGRPEVYRLAGGEYRWYPSPPIASSWDANWGNYVVVNCTTLHQGVDMPLNQPPITEGQAVRCNAWDPAIYRFTSGQIRWYPSPPIAASWDPVWASPVTIDCSAIPRGPPMPMRLPSPAGLADGQAIKCDDPDSAPVYRLTGGIRRWYPSPEIASSWDSNWGNFVVVDCSSLSRGDDMQLKLPVPTGWTLLDGSLVQLSFDGRTLCGVDAADDVYCATENIRGEGPANWRRVYGKQMQVTVYGDSLVGVNRDNFLFFGTLAGPNANWQQMPGRFKHVSTDNKQICGVSADNNVFCANRNISSYANWRQLEGSLTTVVVRNGRLVGTSPTDGIAVGRARGDAKWKTPSGALRQVSYDGLRLCGTNRGGDVWCADSGLTTSPNWSLTSGKMRHVVTHGGDMFATDDQGHVFYRAI